MATPEKLVMTLSPFEKLHVLRAQLEERQEELNAVESELRTKLQLQETQRYLESLSPFYSANPIPDLPTRENIEALEARRLQLHQLLETIETTLPVVMQSTSGEAPPPSSGAAQADAPVRKASFNDF